MTTSDQYQLQNDSIPLTRENIQRAGHEDTVNLLPCQCVFTLSQSQYCL